MYKELLGPMTNRVGQLFREQPHLQYIVLTDLEMLQLESYEMLAGKPKQTHIYGKPIVNRMLGEKAGQGERGNKGGRQVGEAGAGEVV